MTFCLLLYSFFLFLLYQEGGRQEGCLQAPFHYEEAALKELELVDYDICKPILLEDAKKGELNVGLFLNMTLLYRNLSNKSF